MWKVIILLIEFLRKRKGISVFINVICSVLLEERQERSVYKMIVSASVIIVCNDFDFDYVDYFNARSYFYELVSHFCL